MCPVEISSNGYGGVIAGFANSSHSECCNALLGLSKWFPKEVEK